MSSRSTDLEVKDSDPLTAMPETVGDRRTGVWVAEGSGVKWLGLGPASEWEEIYVGSSGPAWTRSNVTDVPGHPIFELDTSGAGQPGRLMSLPGSNFRDRPVTGPSARAFETSAAYAPRGAGLLDGTKMEQ